MVQQLPQTRLDDFIVMGNVLSHGGKEIAKFPTPICQLARLNEHLFVILHPYPIEQQPDYAGSNLWALDLKGKVLWKAGSLNTGAEKNAPNCYAELYFFDVTDPKIFAISSDERISKIFDVATGQIIPRTAVSEEPIRDHIFAEGKPYLMALPFDPPERSVLRAPEPKA
ncbi:MAG: hypothetical protein WAO98_09825 [Alphaproteobacteria bacterium]